MLVKYLKTIGRFATQQKPQRILDFQKKMNLLENFESRMKVTPENLVKLSEEESRQNRLVQTFFQSSKEIEIFFHKNRINKMQNPSAIDKTKNEPSFAWQSVTLPFSTSPYLQNLFIKYYSDNVRVGRLLEVLDYNAGQCAYDFCYNCKQDQSQFYMVTVCCDNIKFFSPISAKQNLIINSYPTSVSTSTIEVRTDLLQVDDQKLNLKATALYLMAARSVKTGKSMQVPFLSFDNEEDLGSCELRNEIGKMNTQKRKQAKTLSIFNQPATSEENSVLHTIFKKQQKLQIHTDYEFIDQTQVQKTVMIHKQDKNVHGNAFGGFIMREAYEIGKDFPEILHIDDINFVEPIKIGTLVQFEAKIAYTKENLICVYVKVKKTDPGQKQTIALDIYITFFCSKLKLKPVYPQLMTDQLYFIEARRRLKDLTY